MALHDDLLDQADLLAHHDPVKPKQASLRRATSAAYYALFHLLIDASTRFMVTSQREELRKQLTRSYDHGHMEKAARAFAAPAANNPWRALLAQPPSAALVDVASTFIMLQEQRHEADYDLSRPFTRSATKASIARARTAFASWNSIAGTEEGDIFVVALLIRART